MEEQVESSIDSILWIDLKMEFHFYIFDKIMNQKGLWSRWN